MPPAFCQKNLSVPPKYLQKLIELLKPSFRTFPHIVNKNYEVSFVSPLCEQEKVIIDWKLKFVTLHEQREHYLTPKILVNTIECLWRECKHKNKTMYGTARDMLDSYLSEFLWRQYVEKLKCI